MERAFSFGVKTYSFVLLMTRPHAVSGILLYDMIGLIGFVKEYADYCKSLCCMGVYNGVQI